MYLFHMSSYILISKHWVHIKAVFGMRMGHHLKFFISCLTLFLLFYLFPFLSSYPFQKKELSAKEHNLRMY